MVNYQNSKIYRLVSASGRQYIGATTQALSKRLYKHKSDFLYFQQQKKNVRYITSFELFKDDLEVEIVLIENHPCHSKEELGKRERYWIENIEGGCVNKVVPTRTDKEYREHYPHKKKEYYKENAEELKEYTKKYNKDHADEVKEKKQTYYLTHREDIIQRVNQWREQNITKVKCECGSEVRRDALTRHKRTTLHRKKLDALKA